MIADAAWIAGGLVLLTLGAEGLVRGSAALALRVGLAPLVVGLTVVAFGTSSPELIVSIRAGLAGQSGLALGNVVGSNVANLALILGTAACVHPLAVQTQVVRFDIPVVIAGSAAVLAFLADGTLARWEGAVLVAGLVAYTAWNVYASRTDTDAAPTLGAEAVGTETAASASRRALAQDGLFLVAGLAALLLGADALVGGATRLALRFGVSDAVVGLTIVAIGTSLPELATSLVAAVRGEGDIAVGNAVGSCVFNLLGVLGPAALVVPLPRAIGWLDLGIMTFTAVLVLPLMRTGFRLSRPEGALLLVGYTGYMGWLAL